MISQKIIKALNDQVAMEAAASQKYLALAIWCDLQAMEQSAQFMFRQADEERAHMMKFIDYILEMGADAVLVNTAIAAAQNPILMANAFKKAVEAGREAFEAKLAPIQLKAQASSPLTFFLG